MKRIKRLKTNIVLHPIMTLVVLIFGTILLSGVLNFFDVNTTYTRINNQGTFVSVLVSVESLLNISGIRYIFSNTVSNFVSFTPLSMLLITLIGIGMMDKSGFLDSLFYVLTRRVSKRVITFSLSLICILASIIGDLSFVVLIPLAALLFKYGKRNPKVGIICAFASLACGISINVIMNSVDVSLIDMTLSSAQLLNADYTIAVTAYFIIMMIASISLAMIITSVTEKNIAPRLGKYEFDEEMTEETEGLTKRAKKGIIISLFCGIIYVLIFAYNIIPGLPLSGNLLDQSQYYYIEMLFGYNSYFNQGFVFIVTFLFIILGLSYGLVTKVIKSHRDFCTFLSHSLDGVGKVIVLLLLASMLIFIFRQTNIGTFIVAYLGNLIYNSGFTGIPLILLLFFVSAISTIFVPGSAAKWAILNTAVIPTFMNAGMSASFAVLIFRAGEAVTYALTPLMAYFVIYIAFMEIYSKDKHDTLFGNMKYLMPYAGYTALLWIILLVLFYIIGLPLGINAFPAL